jgi:hypothetical protein
MAYGVLSVIPGVRLFALLLERNADYIFILVPGTLKTVST